MAVAIAIAHSNVKLFSVNKHFCKLVLAKPQMNLSFNACSKLHVRASLLSSIRKLFTFSSSSWSLLWKAKCSAMISGVGL